MLRAVYVDLDGTLLGPGGSLFSAPVGGFSLDATRALQACHRADVEVVIYSGRRHVNVYDVARLIGQQSFIFELGCGLVLDGELEWLTGGVEPSVERGTIWQQIYESGAPDLLVQAFPRRIEEHRPWSADRDVSHLYRGQVDLDEAARVLEQAGLGWLRLVDNGVISGHGVMFGGGSAGGVSGRLESGGASGGSESGGVSGGSESGGPESGGPESGGVSGGPESGGPESGGGPAALGSSPESSDGGFQIAGVKVDLDVDRLHVYHLVPAGSSKALAVARHMQNRAYSPEECIAIGDSREDMDAADVVGTFWMVANALERDPSLAAEVAGRPTVRVASEGYGAGVYEAVVTTLAEGRAP